MFRESLFTVGSDKVIKNVIITILGIAVLLSGVFFLSYFMRPVTDSRKNICGFYAEEANTLDVVYVGGSVCYYYYQPLRSFHDYGFTSYDFGTDALQPQVVKYEIKEIYKTQSPQLLIIDLTPFLYGTRQSSVEDVINMERVAPFRNVSDNMKYSLNRFEMIEECAPSSEEKWTYHFDLSKYHSLLSQFADGDNYQYILNEKKLITKGFAYHDETRYVSLDVPQNKDEITAVDERLEIILGDLLAFLKENNQETLFVVTPSGDYAEHVGEYNYMKQMILEKGFDYLCIMDCLDEVGLDGERGFRDNEHVNLLGADKYSIYLGEYLNNHYELPDKRNDDKYSSWNEDYETWNAQMEQIREYIRSTGLIAY